MIDYKQVVEGKRKVFKFILKRSDRKENSSIKKTVEHTRLIPSEIKREVWKRDGGKCVVCGEVKNLHFDHDLPYSKGGTSSSSKNVRLLCRTHNLQKSDNIE